jgi:3-isopropylmalate/(R)-2-methylmalate dehydratase small subunit
MKPTSTITATGVPLRRSDVDTDQIIPSEWLKRVERTGFGAGLFSEWREDPSFVLNDPRYVGAKILVAGANFGVGSSREHAVWALQDFGFEAVVSARFGDIFKNNCTKVGIVPVVIDENSVETLQSLIEAFPRTTITIDIEELALHADSGETAVTASFPLDRFTQERFLQGLDDIGLTLRYEDKIDTFEATRASWLPRAKA